MFWWSQCQKKRNSLLEPLAQHTGLSFFPLRWRSSLTGGRKTIPCALGETHGCQHLRCPTVGVNCDKHSQCTRHVELTALTKPDKCRLSSTQQTEKDQDLFRCNHYMSHKEAIHQKDGMFGRYFQALIHFCLIWSGWEVALLHVFPITERLRLTDGQSRIIRPTEPWLLV